MPVGDENQAGSRRRRRVRLDHQRRGYRLDGELQEGFADRADLPEADRLLIARWAERFEGERLTREQRALLEASADRRPSSAQRELRENHRELRTPYIAAIYESLTDEQQRLVADPGSAPGGKELRYPLSVGDLTELTEASERQIRRWADEGLLPNYREGSHRRFYSAALIRAFAIASSSAQEKAVLAVAAHGRGGHFLQLLAATIGRTACCLPDEESQRLRVLCSELTRSSQLMKDVANRSEITHMWDGIECLEEDSRSSSR